MMTPHEEQRALAIATITLVLKEMRPRPAELAAVLYCDLDAANKLLAGNFNNFERKWLIQKSKLLRKFLPK